MSRSYIETFNTKKLWFQLQVGWYSLYLTNHKLRHCLIPSTEMKRVAWPPNIVTNVETIETHEFGNDSGRSGTSMQQPSPLHGAYFSQKLQQEINTGMFPQQAQQQQQEFYQQEETPPKIPPRVLPKPILRQTSGFEAQVKSSFQVVYSFSLRCTYISHSVFRT